MSERGRITQISEGCVEWKVDNFHSLEMHKWFRSPVFSSARGDWMLYIRREKSGRLGRIKWEPNLLYLRRWKGGPDSNMDVEYTLSVKGKNGDRYKEERNRKEFEKLQDSPCIRIFLKDEEMSELLPNDTLTILCDFKCFDPTQDAGKDCDFGSSSLLQKNKLIRDFRELFLGKEDCDVVISVKGQEFPAHRNILKARSPVFASTFRTDMKEKTTGVIEIEDCDLSCFSDFLSYLYCGAVENLSTENVFSLFAAADKYDVQDLRSECLEFVKENLSVDTFCDTVTLALRYSETDLLHLATDFFTKNASQIILTVKWQQFLISHPTQSNELFIKLLMPNNEALSL